MLDARLWPGHCSRCLHWLAPEETAEEQATCEEWQLWVVNRCGELLAASSQAASPPRRDSPQRVLAAVLAELSAAEVGALQDGLNISRSGFQRWQCGASLPRLPDLLKICYRLDLSLLALLNEGTRKSPVRIVRAAPERFIPAFKPRRPPCQLHPGELERSLQAALESNPPVSVSAVIRQLGLEKTGSLCKRFPTLCAAVAKRYAEYRKTLLASRKEAAIREVQRVAREMYEVGLPLRSRALFSRLTMGGLYRPEGRAALRAIKEELGLDQF